MPDSSAAPSQRPRPAILLALAVSLAALVVYMMWPEASQPASPSNPPREQRKQAAAGTSASDPAGALQVQLGSLTQPPPGPQEAGRNPFRFYVPPPPPPPPQPRVPQPGDKGFVAPAPLPPPAPPGPPPIALKFIGTVEINKGKKVAIFTDNRGIPMYAAEGEIVMGQYRVVRIGTESVTLEYLDGRGQQVIPMRG